MLQKCEALPEMVLDCERAKLHHLPLNRNPSNFFHDVFLFQGYLLGQTVASIAAESGSVKDLSWTERQIRSLELPPTRPPLLRLKSSSASRHSP